MLGELDPCGGGDPIPLLKKKLIIGRKSFCDIQLNYANVSSRHCQLEFKDGYWYIQDLDSTNGIRVKGLRCDSECVMPGDEVWIGRYRFKLNYTVTATAPPQDDRRAKRSQFNTSLLEKAGITAAGDKLANRGPQKRDRRIRRESTLGELIPKGGGEPIRLAKPRLTLGRHRDCDIRLRFSTVSTRHCELEFTEGYWLVRDLGSSNGTRVDGELVQEQWLAPGSTLTVAKYRFEVAYDAVRDKPPADLSAASMKRSLLDKAGLNKRK